MVKGITRQVVVIKSPDPKIFEQAIFLVREDVLAEGGVSEKMLLQEAGRACSEQKKPKHLWQFGLLCSALGAMVTGLLWLMSVLLT